MALGAAIGGILVPAVGVALSPVPILAAFQAAGPARAPDSPDATATAVSEGSRRTGTALLDRTRTAFGDLAAATAVPRPTGLAYLCAFLVALAVPAVLVVAVAGPAARNAIDILLILLGIVLLLLAATEWRRRPLPGHQRRPPPWLAGLATMPLRDAALRGARAAVDPKNLTLTVAAALLTARAGGGEGPAVLYAVLGSLTVAAPMLWGARLAPLGDWFARDHAPILVTTLLLTGAAVLGAGLA
ncbi:GAP family protein [Dactylosporangium sucinum]|uniref:Uncharacterized protein n=1 Tax=Dactylosporangium sucinum TaxID=1424081 RepID=A0A917X2D0_9ACTN|nr:GAP family protein [Dactylosporangium sucinum]GGM54283.1 hypothetical protein GCM10007977_064880 [Dactylosporangium sucinum]